MGWNTDTVKIFNSELLFDLTDVDLYYIIKIMHEYLSNGRLPIDSDGLELCMNDGQVFFTNATGEKAVYNINSRSIEKV